MVALGTKMDGRMDRRTWGGFCPLCDTAAVSLQTPVIALVGNDACWSQIAREQVAMLGSSVACGLQFVGERCPLLSPMSPRGVGRGGEG